jgi:hypothetical protein
MIRAARVAALFTCVLALTAAGAAAAPPPSFHRDVLPIMRTACYGCHAAPAPAGGIALGSYAELMKGGKSGAAVVPGKSGASRLVGMLTGAVKPQMPPGGALKPADIDAVRRWVDAGAKNDAPLPTAATSGKPSSATRVAAAAAPTSRTIAVAALGTLRRNVAPPVQALAFSPDGQMLAVGTYQRVLLCDPATREVRAIWDGHADAVRALAFSPDEKWLAAGGGTSGALGQVRLWSVLTNRPARVFGNQADAVSALAFSPDGKRLATASVDKTIQVWDAATARPLQTLRDHADAVLGVAFSPDNKFLASCGADKSVKIWDTTTWRRLYTIGSAHDEAVTAVAFSSDGKLLVTAGGTGRRRCGTSGRKAAARRERLAGTDRVFCPSPFRPTARSPPLPRRTKRSDCGTSAAGRTRPPFLTRRTGFTPCASVRTVSASRREPGTARCFCGTSKRKSSRARFRRGPSANDEAGRCQFFPFFRCRECRAGANATAPDRPCQPVRRATRDRVTVTLTGVNLGYGTGLILDGPGLTVEELTPNRRPRTRKTPTARSSARVKIAPDAPLGRFPLRVLTPLRPVEIGYFVVGEWPELGEKEPNKRPRRGANAAAAEPARHRRRPQRRRGGRGRVSRDDADRAKPSFSRRRRAASAPRWSRF